MKKLLFKRLGNAQKGTKIITINSEVEDSKCKTRIRKSFFYQVSAVEGRDLPVEQPEICIRKVFDTKKRVEKFLFNVKGSFYTANERVIARVYFHHVLNIQIRWKKKIFSPKKSAVLT